MATLIVSARTVTFRNRILNLRTVTAVEKLRGRRRKPFSPQSIAFAVLFGLLTLLVPLGARHLTVRATAFLTLLACVGYSAYALARNREPRDFWLLRVETASGSRNVTASRDERAITEAVSAIVAALESDGDVHTIVNIAESTLISDSIIQDSHIEHVSSGG